MSTAAEPTINEYAPMETAKALMAARYTQEDLPSLVRYNGGFYEWDGCSYVRREDDQLVAEIYRLAEGAIFNADRKFVGDALHALKGHLDLVNRAPKGEPCWIIPRHDDPEPRDLLVLKNGLLNLRSRELLPHTPRFFCLNAAGYEHDPDANAAPCWDKFLAETFGADDEAAETAAEIMGYLLTTDNSQQKVFLMVGPKRSGKGTIVGVISKLVGETRTCSPTGPVLAGDFGPQILLGKTLAIINDARLGGKAEQRRLVEILTTVSGEGDLTVNRKYKAHTTARVFSRFLIVSNEIPDIEDASGALAGRYVPIIIRRSVYGREDRELSKKLHAELPAILNRSLDALCRLNNRGRFEIPASSKDALKNIEDLGSPVGAFIRDECELGEGHECNKADLLTLYNNWALDNGHPKTSTSAFTKDLMAAHPSIKARRKRVSQGNVQGCPGGVQGDVQDMEKRAQVYEGVRPVVCAPAPVLPRVSRGNRKKLVSLCV